MEIIKNGVPFSGVMVPDASPYHHQSVGWKLEHNIIRLPQGLVAAAAATSIILFFFSLFLPSLFSLSTAFAPLFNLIVYLVFYLR